MLPTTLTLPGFFPRNNKYFYEVDGLNKKEAIGLISWNAFKTKKVD